MNAYGCTLARPPGRPRLDDVRRAVCRVLGIDMRWLNDPRRYFRYARPRQIAMYLSRELTGASLAQIGRHYGGRDHSTVVHACRRIETLARGDADMRRQLDAVRAELARHVEAAA